MTELWNNITIKQRLLTLSPFLSDPERVDSLDEDSAAFPGHRQPRRRHREANRKGFRLDSLLEIS